MPRSPRIQFPGAFYHVTSRGNQKQPVFYTPWDRARFLDGLKEIHDKAGFLVHAYCLMDNHYHLLIETKQANLSQGMQHLNTAYTIYFNRRHRRVGHLFQGRFKAILIEAETYALELSRYIHLNPVRAGLSPFPESHPWSSYRDYIGEREPPPWLETQLVLGLFGTDTKESRQGYRAYVTNPRPGSKFGRHADQNGNLPEVLGSPEFIAQIKERFAR
jgi:putative transposase